jgi:hypothetical protein
LLLPASRRTKAENTSIVKAPKEPTLLTFPLSGNILLALRLAALFTTGKKSLYKAFALLLLKNTQKPKDLNISYTIS